MKIKTEMFRQYRVSQGLSIWWRGIMGMFLQFAELVQSVKIYGIN